MPPRNCAVILDPTKRAHFTNSPKFCRIVARIANLFQFGAGKKMFSYFRECQKLALVNAFAGIISGTVTLRFSSVV